VGDPCPAFVMTDRPCSETSKASVIFNKLSAKMGMVQPSVSRLCRSAKPICISYHIAENASPFSWPCPSRFHTMAHKFYRAFYNHFFHDLIEFSEAASAARAAIRQDAIRGNTYGDQVEMIDWFIPITYIHDEVIQFAVQEHQQRECDAVTLSTQLAALDPIVTPSLVILVVRIYDEMGKLASTV